MKNAITSFTLNLQSEQAPPTIKARVGDISRVLVIRLTDGLCSYPVNPDSLAVLSAKKPDRTCLYNVCDIIDNTIQYTFTAETASCPGLVNAEIRLYDKKQELITTAPFYIEVYPTAFNSEDALKSKDEQTALTKLVSDTIALKSSLNTALENGDFNGESAYEIAKRLGYTGSEQEWIESLQYDHSDEFRALADQVKKSESATILNAKSAVSSEEAAFKHASEANKYAQQAFTHEEVCKKSADKAFESSTQTKEKSEEAKIYAETAKSESINAKNEADRASTLLARTPYSDDVANAIKANTMGTHLFLNDVSPLMHYANLQLSSENLIKTPYKSSSMEANGIKITVEKDFSIHISGNPTASTEFVLFDNKYTPTHFLAGNYALSGCPQNGDLNGYAICAELDSQSKIYKDTGAGKFFNLNAFLSKLYIKVEPLGKSIDVVFKPKLQLGNKITPYTQYIDDFSKVKLKFYVSNLISSLEYRYEQPFKNWIFLPKGIYTLSANFHNATSWRFTYALKYPDGRDVEEKGDLSSHILEKSGDKFFELQYNSDYNSYTLMDDTSECTDIIKTDDDYCVAFGYYFGDTTSNTSVDHVMLTPGETLQPYSPFIEPTTLEFNSEGKSNTTVKFKGPFVNLISNNSNVLTHVNYNQDIHSFFNILSDRIAAIENAITQLADKLV